MVCFFVCLNFCLLSSALVHDNWLPICRFPVLDLCVLLIPEPNPLPREELICLSATHPTSDASNTGSSTDDGNTWDTLGSYNLCRTSNFEEMFCCLISFNTLERMGDEKGGKERGRVGSA